METEVKTEQQQAINEFDALYTEAQGIINNGGSVLHHKDVNRLGVIVFGMGKVFARAPGIKGERIEKRNEIVRHIAKFIGL